MVRHIKRPPFHPDMDLRVAREFTFKGKVLKPGRRFIPDKVGCTERLAQQLYEQRKLEQVPRTKDKVA